MLDSIREAADRMEARIRRQEVFANNVANISTSGYKRDQLFQKVMTDFSEGPSYDLWEVPDFSQGALRETGDPFNFAITGDGFFVIEQDDGTYYTRNGNFILSSDGELVLDGAGKVMGENGPIEIKGSPIVNENGEIYVNGALVDKLKIVDFENKDEVFLKKGRSLFELADESAEETEEVQCRIDQGFVEESNVKAVEEMVNMLSVMRYFEATQKVMQTFDSVLDKAANQVGRIA